MSCHRLHLRKRNRQRIHAKGYQPDSAMRRYVRRNKHNPLRAIGNMTSHWTRTMFSKPSWADTVMPVEVITERIDLTAFNDPHYKVPPCSST